MPAVEIGVTEPVVDALTTPEGWIGLLLGLGSREVIRALRQMYRAWRDSEADREEDRGDSRGRR